MRDHLLRALADGVPEQELLANSVDLRADGVPEQELLANYPDLELVDLRAR